MAKKAVSKRAGASTAKKARKTAPKSMPKGGKDPKGGLTAKGRAFFAEKEGAHLRPGVQGPADTPEKMVRKGSFLRRHFAHPRGPVKDEKGQPTRLALSAHAWGEPVPQTAADTRKLAAKGHELLEEYHHAKDEAAEAGKPKGSHTKAAKKGAKRASRKTVEQRREAKKAAIGKSRAKKASAKKAAAKKAAAKNPSSKKMPAQTARAAKSAAKDVSVKARAKRRA